MVEGGGAIRDAASATWASHPCAAPSTSGDCAARRCPVTKRLSPWSKASPARLVMGRAGAVARYRGLSCHGVTSDVRSDAQRDALGRATILCTVSGAVCANSASQRG